MVLVLSVLGLQFSGAEERQGHFTARSTVLYDTTIVRQPGEVINDATLLITDGVIQFAGPSDEFKTVPQAYRINGKGLTVYAGFMDSYSTTGIDGQGIRSRSGENREMDYSSSSFGLTPADNRRGMTPEFQVIDGIQTRQLLQKLRREQGITSALVAPGGRIASGQSALMSLNGLPRRESVIRSPIALHLSFQRPGGRGYPSTVMGVVAHLRQAMSDAEYQTRWVQFFKEFGGRRPPVDPSLDALRQAQLRVYPVYWVADTQDEIHTALNLSAEFGLTPVIVGGRDAWKVSDRLSQEGVAVVLRINFDEPPEWSKENPELPASQRVFRERQRLWNETLSCSRRLKAAGVKLAFSSTGTADPKTFREQLRKVVDSGLSTDDALHALTDDAALILGVSNTLGRVAQGYAAQLVVFDGKWHERDAKVRYVFVDTQRFEYNKPVSVGQFSEGSESVTSKQQKEPTPGGDAPSENSQNNSLGQVIENKDDKANSGNHAETPVAEPFATEIEEDRRPSFQTQGNFAIRNTTVLTVTRGTLPEATLIIQNGKITALGQSLVVPEGMKVIDGRRMYVMPGIIDSHSHFSIYGGINEASLSVVPEVRVADVVDGSDISIYRGLAGGVTSARLLHGSANPIGGQDAVIKLRWGKPAHELVIQNGPRGVKFALGENPKRSSTRFPDSRMGVESSIRRAFDEARVYHQNWKQYLEAHRQDNKRLEPRRDFRLEALVQILEGKMLVHSHCYRADEILMLLNLAESYGIKIQSLQHVLEGYKVAAEIAQHGASCSTFSDWWAYKIEAYDAIPFNAALMTRAGVRVSMKSDSDELMRHLYQEAAKTIKYGNLTIEEALATITINPARQLGLDSQIGSIEVGKDADLAVFNGHPLNGYSRCIMTFVDGELYFEDEREDHNNGYPSPLVSTVIRNRNIAVPRSEENRYILTHARIVPVVGEVIDQGRVLIESGKITAIGDNDMPIPSGATPLNLGGLSVYPGMINASGTLGLIEIDSVGETSDFQERGVYNADLRASSAIHPDSERIPVSRSNGILTVLTQPHGNTIAGQSVLMNLRGWIPQEMAMVDPCALHINFPSGSYGDETERESARKAIEELKEQFQFALFYAEYPDSILAGKAVSHSVPHGHFRSLLPYARGEHPVIIHADRHGDILSAIQFAEELNLKWILGGARDAWKCVDHLKEHRVSVLLGPTMVLPAGDHVPFDAPYRTAALLHDSDVPFAITANRSSPLSATGARNLPFEAAMAVAYGLSPLEGLKAVTLYPAQILGVDDRLGSIEVGKIANLVICEGDLLQPTTEVKLLFVTGRPVDVENRHKRLFERYQRRLKEVQAGQAELGVRVTMP